MKKPTKKQIGAIIGAIATIATIIASMLNSGCATLRERSIVNDVETAAEVADKIETVCNTADLLGVPDADKCVDIIDNLHAVDMVAIYDAAECIDSHKEQVNVEKCIDAVSGWKEVVEKLVE